MNDAPLLYTADPAHTTDPDPSASPAEADTLQAELLRAAMQTMLRRFGVLNPDQTPCGQPIPISQAHAITLLLERGNLRQVDLARALVLSASATSRLVDQLTRRGWLTRLADPADARAFRLALTAAGQGVATRTDRASRGRFAQILAQVPPDRRSAVVAALEVLSAALAAAPRNGRADADADTDAEVATVARKGSA